MRTSQNWKKQLPYFSKRLFTPRIAQELPVLKFPDPPTIDFETGQGLFLWGDVGTGKSLLSAVIALQAYKQRWLKGGYLDVRFKNATKLFLDIRFSYNRIPDEEQIREQDIIKDCIEPELLILDDFAPLSKPSEWVLNLMYHIINTRIERQAPTIYTCNMDLNGVARLLDDRIADRIARSCEIIEKTPYEKPL